MHEPDKTSSGLSPPSGHRLSKLLKIIIIFLSVTFVVLLVGSLIVYTYNNLSLANDQAFGRKIDFAIENSRFWVELHRREILTKKNIALIRMLQDIDAMQPDPLYSGIVNSFMAKPSQPDCWKRLLDPNYPVTRLVLCLYLIDG